MTGPCDKTRGKSLFDRPQRSEGPVERVVIPPEVIHLVRALCDMWSKTEDCRYKAMNLKPEEMKDFLLMQWPVLQGTSTQINTKKIGEQPFDSKLAAKAIKWMLEEAV